MYSRKRTCPLLDPLVRKKVQSQVPRPRSTYCDVILHEKRLCTWHSKLLRQGQRLSSVLPLLVMLAWPPTSRRPALQFLLQRLSDFLSLSNLCGLPFNKVVITVKWRVFSYLSRYWVHYFDNVRGAVTMRTYTLRKQSANERLFLVSNSPHKYFFVSAI